MIKLTNARTGKVTYYPEGDERITVEKFRNMTYAERADLYNSDRNLYESLVHEMNGEVPKVKLEGGLYSSTVRKE